MKQKAIENYKKGYSCSEAVIKAAIESGLIDKNMLPVATAFSGGMSSGCVCGAVAASQMIIGFRHGKNNTSAEPETARALAKEFIDEFKAKNKATCCKVLSGKYEFGSPERKENCTRIVGECCEILDSIISVTEVC